jgi:hypothetical protein
MKNPDDTKNTPGTDAAFHLLSEIAIDPASDDRYPDGTVLIPADSSDSKWAGDHEAEAAIAQALNNLAAAART